MTTSYCRLSLIITFFCALTDVANGFLTRPTSTTRCFVPNRTTLEAKKSKGSRGKGFGSTDTPESPSSATTPTELGTPEPETQATLQSSAFLQSVEKGGSDAIPVQEDLPPEERTKQILREKYGLKTLEEQQLDAKQLQQLKEQRRKVNEWKKKAETGEDFDLIAMVPAPLLKGIDLFLKLGVAITGLAFIAAGLGITVEAWSKTSGDPLPENIDNFIANVVEPNFTTGLFVLLGFSVSLGFFAALQLGSAGAQYKEK